MLIIVLFNRLLFLDRAELRLLAAFFPLVQLRWRRQSFNLMVLLFLVVFDEAVSFAFDLLYLFRYLLCLLF